MTFAPGREPLVRSVSVCMPAYNEEANLPDMIADVVAVMRARFQDFEIVVTNDGSRDRTGEILEELAKVYPELRPIHHERNQGYGAAVYTALSHATKEVIFFTDSDRQFVLEEIDRLLPYLAEADLVVGYRAPRRDPFLRVLFGWGWSALVTLLFGYTARDIDCAFKLFRRGVFEAVGPAIRSRGATFSAEWLVRAKRAGYRIVEVPVSHRPRRAGSPTGARWDVIARAFRELWRFRVQLWREDRVSSR
ncbi:MAG: glycosyltransferase family 2 protein [Anaerolineae bacterium]|nr:glycosyltransferase family 2 protein [Anaerolineae bacterium]MDW8099845.1 glycosyltransferase family 2 protein [Anaerolineae bacterium]